MSSEPPEHIEAHVRIESAGARAVDVLHESTGLPKQRIKQAMTQGAVWITRGRNTQRLRRAKRALRNGDEIHLYYDAAILAETPAEPELIADVGDYSVWNKPYGLRSQGSKWGDHCTLVRWAEQRLKPQRSAFTVHRLDRAANGLMLIAHTKKVAASLSQLFATRNVDKRYQALVVGDFSAAESPLRLENALDGKPASSEVRLLQVLDNGARSLLDVSIQSGRKHQIRRHLAEYGYPVAGDRLYGHADAGSPDLQLTAYLLAFHCPVRDAPVEYRLAGLAQTLAKQ